MSLYKHFANYTQCPLKNLACLRSKTVEEILNAQILAGSALTSWKALLFFQPWLPYVDGKLIRGRLLEFNKWKLPTTFMFKPV